MFFKILSLNVFLDKFFMITMKKELKRIEHFQQVIFELNFLLQLSIFLQDQESIPLQYFPLILPFQGLTHG